MIKNKKIVLLIIIIFNLRFVKADEIKTESEIESL